MKRKPVLPRLRAVRDVGEAIVFYLERPDHIDVRRALQGERDIPAWMTTPD